jgi:K+-transporting ATPase ATPase C chain
MKSIIKPLRPTIVFLFLSTVIFGFAYPAACTLAIQGLFPAQANGSLIVKNDKVLGSELIGQQFTSPQYFWGRLSATAPYPYNASASSGSNLGAANPALLTAVKNRMAELGNEEDMPVDLVTASGSGLDPHISPAASEFQIKRVAQARHISEEELSQMVSRYTEARQFGFLGESRVNVLKLNLALDGKL